MQSNLRHIPPRYGSHAALVFLFDCRGSLLEQVLCGYRILVDYDVRVLSKCLNESD